VTDSKAVIGQELKMRRWVTAQRLSINTTSFVSLSMDGDVEVDTWVLACVLNAPISSEARPRTSDATPFVAFTDLSKWKVGKW
jgi:hypothetical protein